MPVQGFPELQPQASGTVSRHDIEYNVPAQNVRWNTFQLIDFRTREMTAWFLAHSGVEPEKEFHRILRVAGSPYEIDILADSESIGVVDRSSARNISLCGGSSARVSSSGQVMARGFTFPMWNICLVVLDSASMPQLVHFSSF